MKKHRKDEKDPKTILADKNFQKKGHRFNKHARFTTLIDRLINTNLDKEILRESIIDWIQKFETLYPKQLNQELSM